MNRFYLFFSWIMGIYSYHLHGKYIILYPIRKQVMMNQNNNRIQNQTLQLLFHSQDKMNYQMLQYENKTIVLTNLLNSSDIILMKSMT